MADDLGLVKLPFIQPTIQIKLFSVWDTLPLSSSVQEQDDARSFLDGVPNRFARVRSRQEKRVLGGFPRCQWNCASQAERFGDESAENRQRLCWD